MVIFKSDWCQHFSPITDALFILLKQNPVLLQNAWLTSHKAAYFILLFLLDITFFYFILIKLILIKKKNPSLQAINHKSIKMCCKTEIKKILCG